MFQSGSTAVLPDLLFIFLIEKVRRKWYNSYSRFNKNYLINALKIASYY